MLITGTAGVGKTALAVRWAHDNSGLFPDGQLYVNMRGFDPAEPVEPLDALARLLPALGVPANMVPEDLEAAAAMLRTELADRRMLVLLDNVSAVGQVRPLLPGGAQCMTLITSRNSLFGLISREGAEHIELGLFTPETSVLLLKSLFTHLRVGDQEENLAEFAATCARLPLALRVAAEHAIERPKDTLAELIQALRNESPLWDSLTAGDSEQADSIRAVFSWSYRSLAEPTARMFRLLGLHAGQDISTGAAAAIAGVPPAMARTLLNRLLNAHLIEATGKDRFQFHDLLRAYAVDRVSAEPEGERAAAVTREAAWYTHSAAAAVGTVQRLHAARALDPLPPGCEPLSFSSRDAAIAWFRAERANLRSMSAVAAQYGLRRWTWQLAITLYPIHPATRSSLRDWLVMAEYGLTAARADGENAAIATLLNGRAVALTDQTPRQLDQAASDLAEALAIWADLGELASQVRTLNSMGWVALRSRRLTEAAECFRQVHVLGQRLTSTPWTAVGLGQVAHVYNRLGEFTSAADYAAQGLAALEELAARSDFPRIEFEVLIDLSRAQRGLGLLGDAAATTGRAMEIAATQDSPAGFLMWTLLERGHIELATGETTVALATLLNAVRESRISGDQACEAEAMEAIADAHLITAERDQAKDLYLAAALRFEAAQEPWHSATVRAKLAHCLASDGRRDEARAERQAALGLIAHYDDPYVTALRGQLTDEIEG